jgi:hypothetical protein
VDVSTTPDLRAATDTTSAGRPQSKRNGNMKNKDNTKLTFAEIQALSPAERYKLMQAGVKLGKKVEETRDEYRTVTPWYAKVVAALKRDHARALDAKTIAADTPFKKFFSQNCGGELPGRLETLSAFFNTMCMVEGDNGKPLLSEEFYDVASVNSLEIANKCVNFAKAHCPEGQDWRGMNDTLDVINALSKPGDATKKLKEIRARQEPKPGATEGNENAIVLTPESAIEFLLGWIKGASKQPADKAATVFAGTLKLGDAWQACGIADETLNQWATNVANNVAPEIKVITQQEPAAAAAS